MKNAMALDVINSVLAAAALPVTAANWPAWRGPDGNGVSAETNLLLKWSATENVRWRADLPERGNSSPIVWGVFVLRASPTFELLGTNSVKERRNASLAVSDGQLFLRTEKSLWCFAGPK